MKIILTLPHPPSVNSYWLNSKGGKYKYLSDKAKSFREQAIAICIKEKVFGINLKGRIKIQTLYFPPDKRIRDIDNFCNKALLDALTHSKIFEDDSQIDYQTNCRAEIVKGGKIQVIIEEIQENDDFINDFKKNFN